MTTLVVDEEHVVPDRPSRPDLSAVLAVLRGPDARAVLATALAAEGCRLRDQQVRSVHRRGATSIAVVHRVALVDPGGRERDRLWVTHAAHRRVPDGAVRVEVDGTTVHCWPFPRDPYLPGLPKGVNVPAAAALLRRLGRATARPTIHTRSYRPTRRAVVELRPADDAAPAAYVKLLGGRRPRRVRERTTRLVTVHRALVGAGVPVPAVLDHDPGEGRVVLAALPGQPLRAALRGGGTPPPAAVLAGLLADLHGTPPLPAGGDPDAFADVTRHVDHLRTALPHREDDLRRLAATAATIGGPLATVHGDLHDGQVLVADGRVTGLLDVDQTGTGHVAHDVGRLLAGIEAGVLVADGAAATRTADYLQAVRDAVADRCPDRDVAAATAAAWVGLATGPLRVASPTWRTEVEERLDRALWWADEAD